jgi:hypothetical protein
MKDHLNTKTGKTTDDTYVQLKKRKQNIIQKIRVAQDAVK